jgi:hypothetical protein
MKGHRTVLVPTGLAFTVGCLETSRPMPSYWLCSEQAYGIRVASRPSLKNALH